MGDINLTIREFCKLYQLGKLIYNEYTLKFVYEEQEEKPYKDIFSKEWVVLTNIIIYCVELKQYYKGFSTENGDDMNDLQVTNVSSFVKTSTPKSKKQRINLKL